MRAVEPRRAPVDHQDRTVDPRDQLADARLVGEARRQLGGDQRLAIGFQAPPDRVLELLVECGSVKI